MSILSKQQRYRELGRIRYGRKNPEKGYPEALATFRLTSQSHHLLATAAELWGGKVEKWENRGWELITETDSLPVVIPEQDVDDAQWFELWSKGGLQRRCDGSRIVDKLTGEASDCLCNPIERACSPVTRVQFYLPDVPDIGIWLLTSGGWSVAEEMSGTLRLLQGSTEVANLRLEQRKRVKDGQTKRYAVPVLEIPKWTLRGSGLLDSVAGSLRLGAGSRPLPAEVPERPEKADVGVPVVEDTDFPRIEAEDVPAPPLEAEIVDDPGPSPGPSGPGSFTWRQLEQHLMQRPSADTKAGLESYVRKMFRLMEFEGLWVAPYGHKDFLHFKLAERGVAHLGDLKKAELSEFHKNAREAARKKVFDEGHDVQGE